MSGDSAKDSFEDIALNGVSRAGGAPLGAAPAVRRRQASAQRAMLWETITAAELYRRGRAHLNVERVAAARREFALAAARTDDPDLLARITVPPPPWSSPGRPGAPPSGCAGRRSRIRGSHRTGPRCSMASSACSRW